MTELKTDPALLAALDSAVGQELSASERRKQRVSFIIGSLSQDSTITKDQVESILKKLEGEAA